ncbi:thiamine pyrophosphate enzyme, central domain-containing protein [Ditylenchus destructor]|uniref:Thiamine pyrophosphate enzyme, central domain-containing protein n=1 Tax=Ditylenchus destructor TaxID=166010 RepID=A0AAD4ME15_9BILA|nr:thiamine pyrophosphate enzyme, central domain-containing protein [Ditylenchus destructor]
MNARKCHNPPCKSKGKRVTVRRNISPSMALASSPGATSQGLARGTQGGNRLRSRCVRWRRQFDSRTHGRRSAGEGTAGRRRPVRLGLPGGAVLYIYDAFYKQDTIQHVLVRHEQAAVHAADGYARATGEVGVALVTSGPGLNQCGHRHRDGVHGLDPDGDHLGPGANGSHRPRRLPGMRHRRHHPPLRQAQTSRYPDKGRDALVQPGAQGPWRADPQGAATAAGRQAPLHLHRRWRLLGNACNELRTLVDMLGYPVTNTLMGLGAYPASDRKFLGMLGMHGTIEANNAMQNCDVLLAVGARFDDRVIGISKRVKVDIPIVGDVKGRAHRADLDDPREHHQARRWRIGRWWKTIEAWRSRDCLKYDRGNKDVIKPQYVVETLWNMTKDTDTYITSDVGQHQMWAAQYYRFDEPRRWINSGGLGTMGVGIPYAMGIKLAKPIRKCSPSPAKARCRCASRNSPPACSTTRRSRSARQQPLPGYGSPVAGDRILRPLQPQLHGCAAQLREARRGLWPRRHADRASTRRGAGAARGAQAQGPYGVHGFRTDPTRERVPMVKAGMGITEMLLGSEDL